MSTTSEQAIFRILADVSAKFSLMPDAYEAYKELVPLELLNYIKKNYKNKKALVRLMSYMYITMDEEFNQHFIEGDLETLSGEAKYDITLKILYEVEDTLREFERGDHESLKL